MTVGAAEPRALVTRFDPAPESMLTELAAQRCPLCAGRVIIEVWNGGDNPYAGPVAACRAHAGTIVGWQLDATGVTRVLVKYDVPQPQEEGHDAKVP